MYVHEGREKNGDSGLHFKKMRFLGIICLELENKDVYY